MKKKLTDNIPLKIMSVAVAVLVWLIVVNINNPTITTTVTLPDVELVNDAYVDGMNKMALREEEQQPLRVTISGESKTIQKIRISDIHAVADLQQALSLDTDPVMVPITVTCPGISPENIKVSPQNLSIHLEEKTSQEFPVNVSAGDIKPGKGYDIVSLIPSPEKIKITGPASLVNKISKVTASADFNFSGITSDKTAETSLTIIDKNEDPLTDEMMNYLKIDNNGKVAVTVKLWKIRSDVKIQAQYSGEPAEGYRVDSTATVPETISVAGSDEALESLKLQGNILWVPENVIDISGRDTDVEQKINLTEIMPEGLKLTSGSSEDLWVRVNILPEGSHEYFILPGDVKVKNPPENLQVTFETDKIEVRVKAESGDLEDFDESKIKASIDLEDKKEGSYEVPVDIVLPTGYELLEKVTAEVKISEVSVTEDNKDKG